MKIGKFLLFLSILASQAKGGDIVITAGAGRPTTQPPIGAPTGRESTPTRINPLQPNAPVEGRFFEGQCGPSYLNYGCNFMKTDGVSQMRDDSSNYAQKSIDGFQKNLDAENAKVDRDLSAMRAGQALDNSPAGIKIKENLAQIGQLKAQNKATNDSTFDIQIEASRANQDSVNVNFGLAFKGNDTKDYRRENSKIETFVASNNLSGRIQAEYDRADAIEAKIMADGPKYQSERLILTSDGRFALDISKLSLLEGNVDRSLLALKFSQRLLDTAINFAPLALLIVAPEAIIVGTVVTAAVFAKDYYEARTGTRLIGGEKLTDADRAMAVLGASLGAITPVAALGKSLRSAAGAVELMGDLFKGGRIEVDAAEGAAAAVKQAEKLLDSANNARPVIIPHGSGQAVQEMTAEALKVRRQVDSGGSLYRVGTKGTSQTGTRAQYWSPENPFSPGYAEKYGIPPENLANMDFLERAVIKDGSNYITRKAPGVASNKGGGIEVVVPEGGIVS